MTSRRRFRQRLLVIFLLVMTIPYARQVLSSPTLGQDFRAFFAAATVVAEHGNPYDWPTLASVEARLYDEPEHLQPGESAFYEFLAFPEGPWLAFGLVPLTSLPWQVALAIYASIMLLLLGLSAFATFRLLRWPVDRARIAIGATALSAIAFINLFMGQVSIAVFGAFVASWWLARRGHGWGAGIALSLLWLKPNIGLPLPLVIALLEPSMARRVLGGFVAASSVAFGAAALALGIAFLDWPLQIPKMWQAVQGIQPDMASVESFFYPGLGGWVKAAALTVMLVAATAYAVWALRRAVDPQTRGLTVLLVWLAALPFVQSYDMILLLPSIALLLGRNLEGWEHPLIELCVWAFVTLPFCYFLGARLGYFNGFTAIPVALLVVAWHRYRIIGSTVAESAPALAA